MITAAFNIFLTLALWAATMVLSHILRPRPDQERQRPAGLGDFQFPTATEGRPVPVVWGTVKVSGPNVVWYGDLRQERITERQKTGLFSSTRLTVGFRYFIGIQFAICRGPVDELRRVWIDDEVVWGGPSEPPLSLNESIAVIDDPELFGGDERGGGGVSGVLRFFRGDEEQGPGTYIATHQSVGGQTLSYRGTCHLVWEGGYVGNSERIPPWAFEVRRIPNGLELDFPAVNGGFDANPMNVLYEILTDDEWGLGQDPDDIDTAGFATAAATLRNEGNGWSMALDQEQPIEDIISEIERQIDGVLVINRLTGKWEIRLVRDDVDPASVTELNRSNVLDIESFSRGSWADTTNNVRVRYVERFRNYSPSYAPAQDAANQLVQGGRTITAELNFPGIKNPNLANDIAWRELRTQSTPLAKAELTVDRTLWDHNPGDLVRWVDDELGVEMFMRILRLDFGDLTDGRIRVSLSEDIFFSAAGSFAPSGETNWVRPDQAVIPIPADDTLVFDTPWAFIRRALDNPGSGFDEEHNRIWVGARFPGGAATDFEIHASEDGGDFERIGDSAGWSIAAQLAADVTRTQFSPDNHAVQGSITIRLTDGPDSLGAFLSALGGEGETDAQALGEDLLNLLLVGDEFMAFRKVEIVGNELVLSDGYRGLLDTVPKEHAAGTRVWYMRGTVSEDRILQEAPHELRLLPQSARDSLDIGDAPGVNHTGDYREIRPYPPLNLRSSSTSGLWFPNAVMLNAASVPTWHTNNGWDDPVGGTSGSGQAVWWSRRHFRNADEVLATSIDEEGLPPDFPDINNTRYKLWVGDGPDSMLYETDWNNGDPSDGISRTRVLRHTDGEVPERLYVRVHTRHQRLFATYPKQFGPAGWTGLWESRETLDHDFAVTMEHGIRNSQFSRVELTELDNLTALDPGEISPHTRVPDVPGSATIRVGRNMSTIGGGEVQLRIANTFTVDGGTPGSTFSDEVDGGTPGSTFQDELFGGVAGTLFGEGPWVTLLSGTSLSTGFQFALGLQQRDWLQMRHINPSGSGDETFVVLHKGNHTLFAYGVIAV